MQWYEIDKDKTAEMIEKVKAPDMPSLFGASSSEARCAKLPFYTNFLLYRLTNYATLPAFSMDFLSDGEQFLYLDGTSSPIYKVNALGDLILNENTRIDGRKLDAANPCPIWARPISTATGKCFIRTATSR